MSMRRSAEAAFAMVALIGCGSQTTSSFVPAASRPMATPVATRATPSARPVPSRSVSPTSSLPPSASAGSGLTRDQAVALAMQIPDVARRKPWVLSAHLEQWGNDHRFSVKTPAPEPSRLVWVIDLAYEEPSPTGGAGWDVVLDYVTGEVLSFAQWVG
jgi:hypothetical protein